MKLFSPRPRRISAGFTLIELLTVIAIIGILAAILIPTVGSVREKARQSQCVNNLRQWATAINLYANENRNTYYVVNGSDRAWSQVGDNAAVYRQYFARTRLDYGDLLLCPTETVASALASSGSHTPAYTCYVISWPAIGNAKVADGSRIPMTRALYPSRTVLMLERHFTDTAGATLGPGNSYSINEAGIMRSVYAAQYRRHGRGINTVFFDASVRRMSWDNGNANTSLAANPDGGGRGTLNNAWFQLAP